MRTFFFLIALLSSFISTAQKVDCSLKTKEYQDFIIALDFEQAFSSWETVQKSCPKKSEELYADGQKILQFKIDNAPTPEEILHFHQFTESENKEFGLQINRNDVLKTISITQCKVTSNTIKMEYLDLFE